MEDKKELIKKLQDVLTLHEKMRHCYMFSSPSTAAKRRGYEYYNSLDTEFEYEGNHYRISQDTNCSCAHVYYCINYFSYIIFHFLKPFTAFYYEKVNILSR